MKRLAQAAFIAGLFLNALMSARAQDVPPTLKDVAAALECPQQAEQQQPPPFSWTRERGTPITGSENVLIEIYVSGGRRVTVSIIYYPSEAAAIETMKRSLSDKSSKIITGLGDGAYSWGWSDSIALRKNNLIAFVSSISDIDYLLPALDVNERNRIKQTEESALNKNFARMLAHILSNLDKACQPSERI